MVYQSNIFSRAIFVAILVLGLFVSSTGFAADADAVGTDAVKTKDVRSVSEASQEKQRLYANNTADSFEKRPVGLPDRQRTAGQNTKGSSPPPAGASLWKPLLSLLAVLASIILVAFLFRRFALGHRRSGTAGPIEILARSTVSPRQSLCLVKLPTRLLLVGVSPNHIASLATIDDPDEIAKIAGLLEKGSQHSISNTFEGLFHRETSRYDSQEPATDDQQVCEQDSNQQYYETKTELSSLLDKVKGLAKLKFRP